MSKISPSLLAVGICFMSLVASAQTTREISSYSSLCIEDQAVGFNWRNGGWRKTNFESGGKFIARKLNSREVEVENPILCEPKVAQEFGSLRKVSACYLIKSFGAQDEKILMGEMCDELYDGDQLLSIRCSHLSFVPDGAFIKVPWHRNLDPKPANDYKDSLVVSEGKCSRIK